jgi:hypothetical protein
MTPGDASGPSQIQLPDGGYFRKNPDGTYTYGHTGHAGVSFPKDQAGPLTISFGPGGGKMYVWKNGATLSVDDNGLAVNHADPIWGEDENPSPWGEHADPSP